MDDNSLIFGERRRKERKACSRIIEVDDYQIRYQVHLRNISTEGAYIEPESIIKVSVGQELSLTIPYGLKSEDLTVKAKVAWNNKQGIGVTFINTDVWKTV